MKLRVKHEKGKGGVLKAGGCAWIQAFGDPSVLDGSVRAQRSLHIHAVTWTLTAERRSR